MATLKMQYLYVVPNGAAALVPQTGKRFRYGLREGRSRAADDEAEGIAIEFIRLFALLGDASRCATSHSRQKLVELGGSNGDWSW